jgi:ribonuclease P protein component
MSYLRVHFNRSDRELSRLGLVVTRRVGKATHRVRVKRMLRDIFRRHKARLPHSMDVVLIPRGPPRSHREYLAVYLRWLEQVGSSDAK